MTVWTYGTEITPQYGDNRPIWVFTADGVRHVNFITIKPVAGDTIVFTLDPDGPYVFDRNFPPTMYNTYPGLPEQPVGPTNLITVSSVTSPSGAATPAYPSQGYTLTLSVSELVPDSASSISISLYAVGELGAGRLHSSPDPTADPQPTRK